MTKIKKSSKSMKEHGMEKELESTILELALARKTIQLLNDKLQIEIGLRQDAVKRHEQAMKEGTMNFEWQEGRSVATTGAVNHPVHYTQHPSGVECIQITQHFNFNRGNAIKYIWRADEKGKTLEDLRKAAKYLGFEIARLERQATKS